MKNIFNEKHGSSAGLIVVIFVAGLLIGGMVIGYITIRQINMLQDRLATAEAEISKLSGSQNITYQNITVIQNGTSLSQLFEKVKDSVVLIRGKQNGADIQGSGFVYNYNGMMVVVTNNHVVSGTTDISVTFSDGDGYAGEVRGRDPYSDLALLTVAAPESEFKPLQIVSSSTLMVGDPAIAVGNPYGLVGSMTTGIISALGRTISETEFAGGYAIANIIQTSAPINPGNSGGPLLNYNGSVIGITTAIVSNSTGLGFAVPSNAILREIHDLNWTGQYLGHSSLGLVGTDMDYDQAQTLGVNVTFGWRIMQIPLTGNPVYNATPEANDIIIGMNGTHILSGDDLSRYLEENTLPGYTVILTIARANQISHITEILHISVILGTRPAPP